MNLVQFRNSKSLTQLELALKLRVNQTTVSKWEKKKALPSIKTMQKMAEILDVDLKSIVYCFVKDKEKTQNE